MSNRSQLHMLAGEAREAVDLGTRAVELAGRLGAIEVEVHALNNVGSALYLDGSPAGRVQLERSLQRALDHDLREHVARAYVNLVSTEVALRDYRLARRRIGDAQAYFAARDLDAWSHYLAAWTIRLDFEEGNWRGAAEGAQQLLAATEVALVSRLPALVVLARLRCAATTPAPWRPCTRPRHSRCEPAELQRLAPVAAAHAEAAWLERPGADATLASSVLAQASAAGRGREASEIAFWLALRGDDLRGTPRDVLEPALRMQLQGEWDRAAASWAGLGCPFEHAITLFQRGGKVAIQDALRRLSALGSAATSRRLQAGRLRHGQRSPDAVTRGPRATTAAHPAGLTRREAQVLALMAKGLTNGEIAARLVRSTKTVDHHVSAILAKLDARSRAEASARAVQLGLLQTPVPDAGATHRD